MLIRNNSDNEAKKGYRTELKFLCSDFELEKIEMFISSVCMKDLHGDNSGIYRVRSLYFDSADSRCYFESKEGVDNRNKYRIRIYDESKDFIRLEKKIGLHGKKRKESVQLSAEELNAIINGSFDAKENDDKLFKEFATECKAGLLPKLVVAYSRTAYTYPLGNVRITFDREISAIPAYYFLESESGGIPVLPAGQSILEVKYDELLPDMIRDVLHRFELRSTSFSKYVCCVESLFGIIPNHIGRE